MENETITKKENPAPKEVFYRKYRFATFTDMCGQEQVSSFFINTIKYNKVSHAYLFSGPRGTGKTSMARLFAKILNCTGKTTYEACGKCANCIEFENGSAVDIIEMDAASNRKIENIRSLKDDVAFMPIAGRYKIFILDEAHMLTTEAANAFLKTLEEPPPHVLFILATTEIHKIPATILSRCQLVAFSRISVADIMKRLEFIVAAENQSRASGDQITYERDALLLIAKKAQGGMRDALSLLEYVIALCLNKKIDCETIEHLLGVHSMKVIRDFVESIINKSPETGMRTIRKVYSAGNEILAFIESLNSYLNSMLLIKIGMDGASFFECDEEDFADMKAMSEKIDRQKLFRLLEIYAECLSTIRAVPDQLVHLEFVYTRSIMTIDGSAIPAMVDNPAVARAASSDQAFDMSKIEKMISERISALKLTAAPQSSGVKTGGPSAHGQEGGQPKPQTGGPSKLTLEKVKMAWSSIFLPQLKQESIPTHAIMSSGVLAGYRDGILDIDFTKNPFCGERIQSGSHLETSERVFAQSTGETVKFKIIMPSQNRTEAAEQRKKDILEEKKNDPVVQKILEAFDGEIIDVKE